MFCLFFKWASCNLRDMTFSVSILRAGNFFFSRSLEKSNFLKSTTLCFRSIFLKAVFVNFEIYFTSKDESVLTFHEMLEFGCNNSCRPENLFVVRVVILRTFHRRTAHASLQVPPVKGIFPDLFLRIVFITY